MATRPYQGYPYSNPIVTDAPTVDEATASKWNNLPRRPILPPREHSRRPNEAQAQSDKKEPDPVIYIDVPDSGSIDVAGPATPEPETVNDYSRLNDGPNPSDKKEPEPRIYIDLPDSGGSDVAGPASPGPEQVKYYNGHDGPDRSDKKEPEPRIYIDVPDSSGSDVAGPASLDTEPEYVQDTIFYDQFENRRIDRYKDSVQGTGPRRPAPPRPTPPTTLELHGAGSSGYPSTFSSPSHSSREPYDDRFRPIPVSPYPEPPPAYSEIDTSRTPPAATPTPSPNTTPSDRPAQEPPRTVVITHGSQSNQPSGEPPSAIGLASADRKVVYCHHCGLRVHTLAIWQSGTITHIIAFVLFCFMLIPLVVLLYWTNCCKYRNHYCPNCNKKIGYEIPALCISMTYTK